MHTFVRRAPYLFLLVASAVGCSSSDPEPPQPPREPEAGTPGPDGRVEVGAVPLGEACAAYAKEECDFSMRCQPLYIDWTHGSYDACLASTKEQCAVWSALPGARASGADFAACVHAANARACGDDTILPECHFKTGELANDAGCHLNRQCASGYCRRAAGNDCGTCADKASAGSLCQRDLDCISGRCAGVCVGQLGEGDVCSTACSGDLLCIDGTCRKITEVAPGQACDDRLRRCSWSECVNGVCIADTVAEIGESCGFAADGHFVVCRAGECNARGVCAPFPGPGAACTAKGYCASGAVCSAGSCKALSLDVCSRPLPNDGMQQVAPDIAGARRPLRVPSRLDP